jgi:predicted nucleotidyltransferase
MQLQNLLPVSQVFNSPALRALCEKWKIAELALFGSALRMDFQENSDAEILATARVIYAAHEVGREPR